MERGGRRIAPNCARELRAELRARARLLLLRPRRHPLADRRAAVLLAQVHLEPRHRLLEHADLLEPRLVEVVDLPILRVVRHAVVGRVRQHEHARLRHLPLVDRRDEDGREHAAVRARDVRLCALDRRLLLRPVLPPRQRIEHRLQLVDRRRRADRLDAAALRAGWRSWWRWHRRRRRRRRGWRRGRRRHAGGLCPKPRGCVTKAGGRLAEALRSFRKGGAGRAVVVADEGGRAVAVVVVRERVKHLLHEYCARDKRASAMP